MTGAPHVLLSGVCLGQPMGGVRRHNAELLPRVAQRLQGNGGSLTVLEGRVPVAFPLPDSIQRVSTRVPFQPAPLRAAAEGKALAAAIDEAARSGRPFDLVHTAHLPVPHRLPLPFTLTIHDLRSLDFQRAPFVKRLVGGKVLHRATASAARVLVVSEWMRQRVETEFPHTAGRVDVIGNGADHLPRVPRQPTVDPFLLAVGHVEPRKNLELLVRALATSPELPPVHVLGAAKGDAGNALLTLAESLHVDARLRFEADADDARLAELYAAATCAVFPSKLEGFGIGPAEALVAGCPVAASGIPAHAEIVGERAALFDPEDPSTVEGAVTAAVEAKITAPPGALPTWDQVADRWVDAWSRTLA